MNKLDIYCDGGARGNPGPAAVGFVVFDNKKVIKEGSAYLGITTNNIAEYKGVLLALEWLYNAKEDYKDFDIVFHLDSELVVNQLNGKYKVKSKNLIPLVSEVKRKYVTQMLGLKFIHVPRDDNKIADSLVNQELDKQISR